MGIRQVNLEAGTLLPTRSLLPICFRAGVNDIISESAPDGVNMNVGDDLITTVNSGVPLYFPNCGVCMKQTDAILATGWVLTLQITGENQFGEVVTETLTNTTTGTAEEYTQSVNAYRKVTSIVVVANSDVASADTFHFGTENSATTLCVVGMPFKARATSELQGAVQLVPQASGADQLTLANAELTYYTFTVQEGTPGAVGLLFALILDSSVPGDMR